MSDTVALLLVLCAGVVGAVLIGVPWVRWSQKRKAKKQPETHIIALLDWMDHMTVEPRELSADEYAKVLPFRGEHRRKRQRETVH